MNSTVWSFAISGGELYAGGYFGMAGGVAARSIAKWNGNTWSTLGSGMNGLVRALKLSGSDLYAGGEFTIAGGKVSPYIARAYLERPSLSLLRSGSEVTLSWPTFYENFALQQNQDTVSSNAWFNANFPLATNSAIKSATIPLAHPKQFFRLIEN
jgi:hypothetical protein